MTHEPTLIERLAPYRKTVAAVVVGLLAWGTVVVTSDPAPVTASEWLALGGALATALGVYTVPNEPAFDKDRI